MVAERHYYLVLEGCMGKEGRNYGKNGKQEPWCVRETPVKYLNDVLPENHQVNLSDFALFLAVMKNKTAFECVLSIIMDEPDLTLKEVKVEEVVPNRNGKRGIRLDAWAIDESYRQFDMEMQNEKASDCLPKRSRFYQSMIDSPILKSGKQTKYKQLPSTYVIFITQQDVFGKDRAKYTFTEQCEEVDGLQLGDETQKIFLNMASLNGSEELVSLLQYMKNTDINNPDIKVMDERIKTLDKIVTEVKETEEWEDAEMNLIDIGIERGIVLGIQKGIQEVIVKMFQ